MHTKLLFVLEQTGSRRFFFGFRIGSKPVECPLYRRRNWGRRRDVIPLGLKTILVGHVAEGDRRSIIGRVLERARRLEGLSFWIARILQLTLFFRRDAVRGFVAEKRVVT